MLPHSFEADADHLDNRECDARKRIYGMGKLGMLPHSFEADADHLDNRECDARKRIYGMGKLGMLPHSGQPFQLLLIFYEFVSVKFCRTGPCPTAGACSWLAGCR